jgi:CRP/FNR family transcriptional regulator
METLLLNTPITPRDAANTTPWLDGDTLATDVPLPRHDLRPPVPASLSRRLQLDALVTAHRALRNGSALFRAGDAFHSLYAIEAGTLKSRVSILDGREQVTGFHLSGELLGFDGIGSGRHTCDAIALESTRVCAIPYAQLARLSPQFADVPHQLRKIISSEIIRDHGLLLLLGSMRAQERVASFLLNLASRLQSSGEGAEALVLHMSREEIGSYLGLALETISRTFSKLQDERILEVKYRDVRIVDVDGLRRVSNGMS